MQQVNSEYLLRENELHYNSMSICTTTTSLMLVCRHEFEMSDSANDGPCGDNNTVAVQIASGW